MFKLNYYTALFIFEIIMSKIKNILLKLWFCISLTLNYKCLTFQLNMIKSMFDLYELEFQIKIQKTNTNQYINKLLN